nr:MAG TPA: hypothetical protein [Caudoviricetes sp.]
MKEENRFIREHIFGMDTTIMQIRGEILRRKCCSIKEYKEPFHEEFFDKKFVGISYGIVNDYQKFIHHMPTDMKDDMRGYHPWKRLKYNLDGTQRDLQKILRYIMLRDHRKERERAEDAARLEKCKELRCKRLENAEQMQLKPMSEVIGEGSN